jgi:peptidoglycan hydrolase-like protein with peptidoglycan-binding domain
MPAVILPPRPRITRPIPPAPQTDGLLDPSQTGKPTVPVQIAESNPTQMAAVSETKPIPRRVEDLSLLFKGADSNALRSQAIETAMNLWYPGADVQAALNAMSDDGTFFRLAAAQNGLLSHPIPCNLNLITKLNLPVIMALQSSAGRDTAYVTVLSISDEHITIQKGTEQLLLDKTALTPFCTGTAYLIWKNFINIQGTIPLNAPPDSIVNLKIYLRNIGFTDIDILPAYDAATREVIKNIQSKHGLQVDGIVGSLTKIALYNEKKTLPIPHIITGSQKGKGS